MGIMHYRTLLTNKVKSNKSRKKKQTHPKQSEKQYIGSWPLCTRYSLKKGATSTPSKSQRANFKFPLLRSVGFLLLATTISIVSVFSVSM